jgi:competence protein ComFC
MLLDFLFPRRCLGCGRWGSYFCPRCVQTTQLQEKQICPICERPSINGFTHARCFKSSSLDGLISLFTYEGLAGRAIAKLKYQFVTDLAAELIAMGVPYLAHFPQLHSSVIVPVPLHPQRKRWRGFNQAEVLGSILARKVNSQISVGILSRIGATRPQVGLKQKERRKNLRGVFEVKKGRDFFADNPKLVVFDDVWTTGSTLRECGLVLKRAGAKSVWGLTLVR